MQKNDLLVAGTDIRIISTHACKYCSEEYPLYSLEKEQYDKNGFRYPDSCPTCRFRLLYSFFNDKHLYNRKDTKTGKSIVSILSDDYAWEVIEANAYRDLLTDDYGLRYSKDIGMDSFDDFLELCQEFPKFSRLVFFGVENGNYSSHCGTSKNLYLSYCVFADCEDVYYSLRVTGGSKNVFDSYNIVSSSNIYSCHTIGSSHDVSFSRNSVDSSGLLFCSDMNNCRECIFCCNQVNASYMVYNKQYSKEEYLTIKSNILPKLRDYDQFVFLKQKFEEFLHENLIDATLNVNNCQKVNAEATFYSFNCVNTYTGVGMNNCVNIINGGDFADDKSINIVNCVEFGSNSENVIGSFGFGYNVYNIFHSGIISEATNLDYCIDMESCEDCLFCIGLRNKKYCILNKQYEKTEYFREKAAIIDRLKMAGKWGESLPWSMSPFPYNDTLTYDYFKVHTVIAHDGTETVVDPSAIGTVRVFWDAFISDAELDLGGPEKIRIKWRTRNKEINIPENMETLSSADIPNIDDAKEDIIDKALICEESGRPFRIIQPELEYLKKKWFPLPRVHHENRIDKVFSSRPTGQMFVSVCDKCHKETLSVFRNKPDNRVYCADCYKQYMYG